MAAALPGAALIALVLAFALGASLLWAGQGALPAPAGSLVAAAALPWLALAGLPRRVDAPRPGRRTALVVGLAAPLLALACALELQAGAAAGAVGFEGGAALALCAGLALAAERGADRALGARAAHGLAWLVLVLALPLLAAVVGWNDAPGGAGRLLEGAAALSPLGWAFARAGPGAPPAATDAIAPALVVLLLIALPRGGRR